MAAKRLETGSRDGQGTVEYVGLIALVGLVLALLAAGLVGPGLPGGGLVRAIAGGILCAVGGPCDAEAHALVPDPLAAAYGPEVAAIVERGAPHIFFEDADFVSLPVDFRRCRERSCADTIREGSIAATQTGLRPTAFVHVVDCREETPRPYECGGSRSDNVYVQYWLYYPDSLTHGLGRLGGYHADDWESFQIRVGPGGDTVARASSHHGYNGRSGGPGSIGSDTGWSPRAAWEQGTGSLHVAAGSHAGTTQMNLGDSRAIRREDLRLIPAEPIAGRTGHEFAVSPPWEKEVWHDPEAMGT